MKNLSILFLFIFCTTLLFSQSNSIVIKVSEGKDTISRHIYGQFSEHLGKLFYGGIWVGEDSPIPNTRGIRNDIVAALKHIKVPNLRWPGGCFADEYHWMDGIGPQSERKKMVNSNWGGVTEDNSFGTHEFMDLCEQLNCEPVICGNIGSGTVEEMADWVEYLTSDGDSPMTQLRRKNGREKPWKVKYWCVGNETWGCGGIMDAEYYANEMARYSHFLRNYSGNQLYKVASGGLEEDYDWTETVMKKWASNGEWLKSYMSGYSLHHYTITHDWAKKGFATEFDESEWFLLISKSRYMEDLIDKHSAIMDKYDPEKRVGLMVDEWGIWHDVEPGSNPGFLYQQNTLRDAMTAAIQMNIFNRHCDRVQMANIAQVVNVLQAMILTEGEKMLLTPSYHVFDLYKVHQDALHLPLDVKSENYKYGDDEIPALYATASKAADGTINISLVNVNPSAGYSVPCSLNGVNIKSVTGRILTSENMQDHNTFEEPDKVHLADFTDFKIEGSTVQVNVPSKSILTLEIKN